MPKSGDAVAVNRKKQKRREKQAAKLAAEQPVKSSASNGTTMTTNGHPPPAHPYAYASRANGMSYDVSRGQYDASNGEIMYTSDEDPRK